MSNEINFDEYLTRRQMKYYNLVLNPLYISVFLSFKNAHEQGIEHSPFRTVLLEIEKQAQFGGEVYINGFRINFQSFRQNPIFSASAFRVRDIYDVAFLHFARNIMINYGMTFDFISSNPEAFERVPDYKNQFHKKNTSKYFGNENNVKWVTKDGAQEYIFKETPEGSELVVDPINQGSFNYCAASEILGHTELDVMPWTLFGNFITDPTLESDRLPTQISENFEPKEIENLYALALMFSLFRTATN